MPSEWDICIFGYKWIKSPGLIKWINFRTTIPMTVIQFKLIVQLLINWTFDNGLHVLRFGREGSYMNQKAAFLLIEFERENVNQYTKWNNYTKYPYTHRRKKKRGKIEATPSKQKEVFMILNDGRNHTQQQQQQYRTTKHHQHQHRISNDELNVAVLVRMQSDTLWCQFDGHIV